MIQWKEENVDRWYEIDRYILTESQAKDEKTFLYQLDENFFFEKDKFNTLLFNCKDLANQYKSFGKSDNYIEVTKGIFIIFKHVFFLLFNHFVE